MCGSQRLRLTAFRRERYCQEIRETNRDAIRSACRNVKFAVCRLRANNNREGNALCTAAGGERVSAVRNAGVGTKNQLAGSDRTADFVRDRWRRER